MIPGVRPAEQPLSAGELDFDKVYREHFDFVWRTTCRLGATAVAEDVAQQVFLVVHRQLPSFERRSTLRTWLFAITRRVVRDHFRTLERAPAQESLSDSGPLADNEAAGPIELTERAEARRLLHQILDRLDQAKREVFVLAELEGFTIAEMAAALEVNQNTLYARLRAARNAFDREVERLKARQQREQR